MTRVAALATLIGLQVLVFALFPARAEAAESEAQPASRPSSVDVQTVADGLYLLKAGDSNLLVLVTNLGVTVVDTGPTEWGRATLAAIRTITDRPVTTVINTHAHGDHTGGNAIFGSAVDIVAQEDTRRNMERLEGFADGNVNFLPKLMFKEKMSLGSGRDRIDLHYFGAGHTNGDAWILFPGLRVAYAGDMFAARRLPIVDGRNGGSGVAYPASLGRAARAMQNIDVIITGHEGIVTRRDLEEFRAFTMDFRDTVVDGFNHGLSVDEVVSLWAPATREGYAIAPRGEVKASVELMFGELNQ